MRFGVQLAVGSSLVLAQPANTAAANTAGTMVSEIRGMVDSFLTIMNFGTRHAGQVQGQEFEQIQDPAALAYLD